MGRGHDKPVLRERFGEAREALSAEEVAAASAALCRRLARMAVLRTASTVMTYLAFRNEPDLNLLIDLLPKIHWTVPRMEGKELVAHTYEPTQLVLHRYGMLEPPPDAPVVDPTQLDVVLVPGVSFDRHGGRLGFGGGFYDRFLVRTSAVRIGVLHDACLGRDLPCDEHDQRMDWIVTPREAVHCSPLWRRDDALGPNTGD